MARMYVVGMETAEIQLEKLKGRERIRTILMAGAERSVQEWKDLITKAGHVRSGGMRDAVAPGDYYESLDGGKVSVYPQGNAPTGISQAAKAFIINYGYKQRSARMGDKFITNADDEMAQAVIEAMQEKADELLDM